MLLRNLKGEEYPIYVTGAPVVGEQALKGGDIVAFSLVSGDQMMVRWDAAAPADDATVAVRAATRGVACASSATVAGAWRAAC